jgi:hypothetical protein
MAGCPAVAAFGQEMEFVKKFGALLNVHNADGIRRNWKQPWPRAERQPQSAFPGPELQFGRLLRQKEPVA